MPKLISSLRFCFFLFIVRPTVFFLLGLSIRHFQHLPQQGPALIIANHNSHLDTLVLMSLFPLKKLSLIHPIAASDYFLSNRWLAWFSTHIMGIIAISRKPNHKNHPFAAIYQALEQNNILIFYPEGSRGQPEQLSQFKQGIAHIAEKHQKLPITPIFLHGLGKALPKGEALFVPFFCDVLIGQPLYWQTTDDRKRYLARLQQQMNELAQQGHFPAWD